MSHCFLDEVSSLGLQERRLDRGAPSREPDLTMQCLYWQRTEGRRSVTARYVRRPRLLNESAVNELLVNKEVKSSHGFFLSAAGGTDRMAAGPWHGKTRDWFPCSSNVKGSTLYMAIKTRLKMGQIMTSPAKPAALVSLIPLLSSKWQYSTYVRGIKGLCYSYTIWKAHWGRALF